MVSKREGSLDCGGGIDLWVKRFFVSSRVVGERSFPCKHRAFLFPFSFRRFYQLLAGEAESKTDGEFNLAALTL